MKPADLVGLSVQASSDPANIGAWASRAGSPACLITQSFEQIQFESFTGQVANLEKTFAGRIFGPDAEIRWVREGDSWQVWLIQETAGLEYSRVQRRYYLWGLYQNGWFDEQPRIPGLRRYPLPPPAGPVKNGARAFLQVAEYLPAAPSPWPGDPEEMARRLNQPRVVAHRFLSVEVDNR